MLKSGRISIDFPIRHLKIKWDNCLTIDDIDDVITTEKNRSKEVL